MQVSIRPRLRCHDRYSLEKLRDVVVRDRPYIAPNAQSSQFEGKDRNWNDEEPGEGDSGIVPPEFGIDSTSSFAWKVHFRQHTHQVCDGRKGKAYDPWSWNAFGLTNRSLTQSLRDIFGGYMEESAQAFRGAC